MQIGIDASRAFLKNRTGIEEYAYRVIEHLKTELPKEVEVVLYVRDRLQVTGYRGQSQGKESSFCHSREGGNLGLEEVGRCQVSAPTPPSPPWRADTSSPRRAGEEDKEFPKNWKIKEIGWRRFWTQGGLAWEMFRRPVDVLLVPAHTVPWIHPKKTVVVVHGLEYEFCPGAYSLWERWYMRATIWLSCRWAWRIVAVSENTKRDLIRLYGVAEEKIAVIYEGRPTTYDPRPTTGGENFEFRILNFDSNQNDVIPQFSNKKQAEGVSDSPPSVIASSPRREQSRLTQCVGIASSQVPRNDNLSYSKFQLPRSLGGQATSKFLLFIGRIEERKNVVRIIEAFEMLKEKYKIPHMLVLAGKDGYGSENAKCKIQNSKWRKEILLTGYISEEEKAELFQNADVFVFPSLYEGFGLPILEAQAVGVPVVTSNVSSMPEVVSTLTYADLKNTLTHADLAEPQTSAGNVAGASTPSARHGERTSSSPRRTGEEKEECSAVLVDPQSVESIAEGIYSILSDNKKREQLVSLGYENVKRFSWGKCSKQISNILTND